MHFKIALSAVTSGFIFCACSGVPSSAELCKHVAKISDSEGPGELEKCAAELKEMKKAMGADAFATMGKCIMKAKDKEAAGVCAMAAISRGAAKDYIDKSKTSEAQQFVRKMYDGARMYYMDPMVDSMGLAPVAKQFPGPSVGPTPPLGTCCENGGKCGPEQEQWASPTWEALMFSVDDPHYYSYEYTVDQAKSEFTVLAHGDLDCDGTYSTFSMTGIVSPDGEIGPSDIKILNETE